MKNLKEYEIEYLGLKNGPHVWNFEIDNTFFEIFEYSEIRQGKVNVQVVLQKCPTMLTFSFNIHVIYMELFAYPVTDA
ncbi:MAG TPA: hypothetical protein P5250_02845 [Bacteroidales bacterium]|nr:hypothetical protein [Bacteroidales bacterium]